MTALVLQALNSLDPRLPAIDDGRRCLTYGELARFVTQESRWLASCGARRCATLARNGAGWVVTDLALMTSGALHVPIPANFTSPQIEHLLTDAEIHSVLTDDPQRIQNIDARFISCGASHRTGLSLLQRTTHAVAAPANAFAKITYTSGSTAAPKGVVLEQETLDQVAQSLAEVTAGLGIERHMCLLPLPTLLENIAGIYVPVLHGAQIHVRPSETLGIGYGSMDPKALLQAIDDIAPHSLVLVPELLRLLLQAIQRGWRAPADLKFIAVGGASVSPSLLIEARASGLPVYEGYGLSECGSVVCLNTPQHDRPGSVGRPLPHARVRIDSYGEICVAGATMSGYLNGATTRSGEIRTGDLGEIDEDGFVYVRGRSKNMFITSMGRNVMPEWVERELTCEPAIATALVSGEARPYSVALLACAPNATGDCLSAAVARANERLPDYARVRRWMAFPEFPTTTNGLMTANGRLRRTEVFARYGAAIDSLYEPESAYAYIS